VKYLPFMFSQAIWDQYWFIIIESSSTNYSSIQRKNIISLMKPIHNMPKSSHGDVVLFYKFNRWWSDVRRSRGSMLEVVKSIIIEMENIQKLMDESCYQFRERQISPADLKREDLLSDLLRYQNFQFSLWVKESSAYCKHLEKSRVQAFQTSRGPRK